jgi:hypothetical protein
MFKSIEKTALQEIGPRFTLKLKWLRKGLPAVTGGASTAVPVAPGADESEDEDEEVDDAEEATPEKAANDAEEGVDEAEERAEGSDEDAEEEEEATPATKGKKSKRTIPPLNAQGEFEWQWKVRPVAAATRSTLLIADRAALAVSDCSRNSRRRARPSSSSCFTTCLPHHDPFDVPFAPHVI